MENLLVWADRKRTRVLVENLTITLIGVVFVYFYLLGIVPEIFYSAVKVICLLVEITVVFLLAKGILDYYTQAQSTLDTLFIKRGFIKDQIVWKKTQAVYLIEKRSLVEEGRYCKVFIFDTAGRIITFNLGILTAEGERELVEAVELRCFENQIPPW